MLSIKERVDNGVEWLDANVDDWRNKIDSETLDISDCSHCVLGQVFGGYAKACRYAKQDGWGDWPEELGFLLPQDQDEDDEQWEELREEWIKRINLNDI